MLSSLRANVVLRYRAAAKYGNTRGNESNSSFGAGMHELPVQTKRCLSVALVAYKRDLFSVLCWQKVRTFLVVVFINDRNSTCRMFSGCSVQDRAAVCQARRACLTLHNIQRSTTENGVFICVTFLCEALIT
jgi:hypothetical protein